MQHSYQKRNRPGETGAVSEATMWQLDRRDDIAEDFADGGTEERKDDNNDHSNQNEDQRVLDQTLGLFFRSE